MDVGPSKALGAPGLRPWRFILTFGVVSLLADMVYEGARSIIGPYLATLGASALVVGLVAGTGEFIGYGLRVASGYVVTKTGHYWSWTIGGYALTVLSVPLIGVTAALAPALLLYGSERLGKAVRSPAKDTLLSYAAAGVGRGRAFGVHQALDQLGAVAGPLLLAAVLSWHEGDYRLAFGVLAVPGVAVLGLLLWLRNRVPDPRAFEEPGPLDVVTRPAVSEAGRTRAPGLPSRFWWYAGAVALMSCGVASFPLLAFHAAGRGLLSEADVPLLFAVAMLVDGASGLLVGRVYDRRGPTVLLGVPLAAGASSVAFADQALWLWLGVAVWGLVNGILDSTVKAVVAELVPSGVRAVAYGWLALARGAGLLLAGGVLGAGYGRGVGVVVVTMLAVNLVAFGWLAVLLRALPATVRSARR